jgi:predicted HTH domain antitoxin
MSLVISSEILESSGLSETEFMLEIAIMLFQQEKISIGKASRIAGMNQIEFQHLLAKRNICIHYDVDEFQEDLKNLQARGWL